MNGKSDEPPCKSARSTYILYTLRYSGTGGSYNGARSVVREMMVSPGSSSSIAKAYHALFARSVSGTDHSQVQEYSGLATVFA